MKRIVITLLVIASAKFAAFSQTPGQSTEETSQSAIHSFNDEQGATAVVIIDDDELGVTISPNPANNHITITANKSLSGKAFVLVDLLGITRLRQSLNSSGNTINISTMNNGTYTWLVVNSLNVKSASGNVIIQH